VFAHFCTLFGCGHVPKCPIEICEGRLSCWGGMTIGFLIDTCEPFYRGGYERRVWSFARELVRQGHEVIIYTSCPRDEVIEEVQFIRLSKPRVYFNRRGVRNIWADLLFSVSILRLFDKVYAYELDILDVCATPFVHLPVAALMAWFKKIPTVVTCHEALLASLPDYVKERGHGGPVGRFFFFHLLRFIYKVGMWSIWQRIAVSKRTGAALEAEYYPPVDVVEFGLEPEAFAVQAPEERPEAEPVRFVFCGRLTPIKQVDQAVEALLSLRGSGASFHFDIIGEGSERVALEKKVETAKAGDAFTFHGELSEAAKRDVLGRSDVFILSSPREGFSIATLEAMAQGCCAVVVNDPTRPNGALDFVQDGEQGLVVAPGQQPMREALERLLYEPALRLRLRQAAWNAAGRYLIAQKARHLMDVYTSSAEV
jgi:glycosyltransferase involved in cell wall biosynthesis